MASWTTDELKKIEAAEELSIASLRADGTLRNPVTIWVVRAGDNLYVRSVNGRNSGWFRGVQAHHEGQIRAGGVTKDVALEEISADNEINKQLDTAYATKYRRYAKSIIDHINSAGARAATIKLNPH
ncbi:MAG: DUF2255 family protein [Chloroflexi bacterium]|nr:DUF2255 family protein [Chloroflexota bacterium]OJV92144.1 MAG: hypothetical protein BGO39_09505 [Chloroflexi bacterium 54-19]